MTDGYLTVIMRYNTLRGDWFSDLPLDVIATPGPYQPPYKECMVRSLK